jgi:hypothetical protein
MDQVSKFEITYPTDKFIYAGSEVKKDTSISFGTPAVIMTVTGFSNTKKTIDLSGITCEILNTKILTQKIDCDLSC